MFIKRLDSNDIDHYKEFVHLVASDLEQKETKEQEVFSNSFIRKNLLKEHIIYLVAINDIGHVVGGLLAYVLDKYDEDSSEVYIYDLVVAKEFRRKKIATMLIGEIKKIANNFNSKSIYVQTDTDNKPAIKLYGSLGTGANVFHFDIFMDK